MTDYMKKITMKLQEIKKHTNLIYGLSSKSVQPNNILYIVLTVEFILLVFLEIV